MKKSQSLARLERIVADDLPVIGDKTIFRDGDRYLVFGTYEIHSRDTGFLVTRNQQPVEEFGSLRSALAWCSADKLRKTDLAGSILDLEQKRQRASADIRARNHLASLIRDQNRRDAARIKLEHRRQQIRSIENQLDKCINLAKYWQIRGFNNETRRIRRSSPH